MAEILKGTTDASDLEFSIVVSRFNRTVTEPLLNGALEALRAQGADDESITVAHVPGAFELPIIANTIAETEAPDAIICLGAVVRGETQHHHFISQAVCSALQEVSLTHNIPVILGLLTTDTMAQALQRAGDGPGNKGHEAAMTAIEVATLRRELQ